MKLAASVSSQKAMHTPRKPQETPRKLSPEMEARLWEAFCDADTDGSSPDNNFFDYEEGDYILAIHGHDKIAWSAKLLACHNSSSRTFDADGCSRNSATFLAHASYEYEEDGVKTFVGVYRNHHDGHNYYVSAIPYTIRPKSCTQT